MANWGFEDFDSPSSDTLSGYDIGHFQSAEGIRISRRDRYQVHFLSKSLAFYVRSASFDIARVTLSTCGATQLIDQSKGLNPLVEAEKGVGFLDFSLVSPAYSDVAHVKCASS